MVYARICCGSRPCGSNGFIQQKQSWSLEKHMSMITVNAPQGATTTVKHWQGQPQDAGIDGKMPTGCSLQHSNIHFCDFSQSDAADALESFAEDGISNRSETSSARSGL